ncbi:hypothetical protein SAMN05421868_1084 [Paenibacillus naphthalenovorans]|nr:hypothetical protein SAMN05421868_1084 [Paenibacillus naphthalenovorans]
MTLHHIASQMFQTFQLSYRFHAFSDHFQSHTVRHIDHGLRDHGVSLIHVDILYKTFVNFQNIDGKVFQIIESGIPFSKIVNRTRTPIFFRSLRVQSIESIGGY